MAEIPSKEYDAASEINLTNLFLEMTGGSDQLAYHGTSSVFESNIDEHGIRAQDNEQEIRGLASIFENMNWFGRRGGGLPVLATFTWLRTVGLPRSPDLPVVLSRGLLAVLNQGFCGRRDSSGDTARN